jgi:hypothetical protein
MTKRFEMSMMGELKFFLGFQIKKLKEGIFISQTKYTHDMRHGECKAHQNSHANQWTS